MKHRITPIIITERVPYHLPTGYANSTAHRLATILISSAKSAKRSIVQQF